MSVPTIFLSVYMAIENGYMGYYFVPGLQHESMLQYIELRGSGITEGFRIKEEYKGFKIDTSGTIIDDIL